MSYSLPSRESDTRKTCAVRFTFVGCGFTKSLVNVSSKVTPSPWRKATKLPSPITAQLTRRKIPICATNAIPRDIVGHDRDIDIDRMISGIVYESGNDTQRRRQGEIREIGKSRTCVFNQRKRPGFKSQSGEGDNHVRARSGKAATEVDGREVGLADNVP